MPITLHIVPDDPHYDAMNWLSEMRDAEVMAHQAYLKAVITGKPEYKLAFFDYYRRAKEIEEGISNYFAA